MLQDKLIRGSLFLIIPILASCAQASLVESIYEPSRAGAVKYKNGILSAEESEKLAKNIMAGFCSSGYRVIQESDQLETVSYSVSEFGIVPINRPYIYVKFLCNEYQKVSNALEPAPILEP